MDESTDVSNNILICSHLLDVNLNIKYKRILLLCCSLPLRTPAKSTFNSSNHFIIKNEIELSKCIGICPDGARAMSGIRTGLIALIQGLAPQVVWNYFCITGNNNNDNKMKLLKLSISLRLVHLILELLKFCAARWEINMHIYYYTQKYVGCYDRKALNRLFELRDEIRLI